MENESKEIEWKRFNTNWNLCSYIFLYCNGNRYVWLYSNLHAIDLCTGTNTRWNTAYAFFTKVKKFGMILILSLLMGILMLITGMGYYSIIVGLISGLISEIIYRSGNYQSSAKAILAYAVFSVWMWGNFLPIFFNPTVYFSTRQDLGLEYAQTLISLLPSWMCPVLLIITFLCGLIGGVLGRSVLKKHFIKAGLV